MNIVELGRRYAHAQEGALALGFDANLATLADGLSKFPRLSHVQHGRRPPRRVIFKTANVQVIRQLLLEQTADNIIINIQPYQFGIKQSPTFCFGSDPLC